MKRSYAKFVIRLEEIGLRAEVAKRSLTLHVSLRELYDGGNRTQSISTARRAVYTWLSKEKGKSCNEIARLFDRAPYGVWKMLGRKEVRA